MPGLFRRPPQPQQRRPYVPEAPPAGGSAHWLVVVADAGAPTATDTYSTDRLTALGHTFDLISDETADPGTSGYDAILISDSATTANLGTKYVTWAKPAINCKGASWDEWQLVSGGLGNAVADSDWVVIDDTHAIAVDAGITGTITVGSGDWRLVNTSNLLTDAVDVCDVSTNNSVLFVLDAGDTLNDASSAPGIRIAIGFHTSTIANVTATFQDVLDACINYATPPGAGGGTDADAELAAGTGAAHQPSVDIKTNAALAAATGAALQNRANVAPRPATATATGAALQPSIGVKPSGGLAAGTGAARAAAPSVGVNAELASATGAAYDATVSTENATNAPAELAEATGTAPTASVNVAPNAGLAAATGAALAPSPSVKTNAALAAATGAAGAASANVQPNAGIAGATGAARAPAPSVGVRPATASATGAAYDATVNVSGATNVQAPTASATGAAHQPSVSIAPSAGHASAIGAALAGTVLIAVNPAVASAVGAAHQPDISNGTAEGGHPPQGSAAVFALVGSASRLGPPSGGGSTPTPGGSASNPKPE